MVTDGDKPAFHASVAVLSRAIGTLEWCGIIHSAPGSKDPRYSKSHAEGLPEDWLLAVTPNGSMELRVFEAWCHQFVQNLPPGFGKGGKVVILLFDGHASRWTFTGLWHLLLNNVQPFCLASHTSAWSQVSSDRRMYRC